MCVFNSFWTIDISCPWFLQNTLIQSPCIWNCPPLTYRVSFENHIDLRSSCYSKLMFVLTYFDFVVVHMFHKSFRLLTTSPLIFPGDFLHSPQWAPCNKLWLHQICPMCFFMEGQEPPFCHSHGSPWYVQTCTVHLVSLISVHVSGANVQWWKKDNEQKVGACFITKVYCKPTADHYKKKKQKLICLCVRAAFKNCVGICH